MCIKHKIKYDTKNINFVLIFLIIKGGVLKMKKALIVGLNDYPGCPLSWCDNDAIAVKELIESNGDGSPNFDIKYIIGECSKVTLRSAIAALFEGDSEISLLYFSGHGADTDGGYFMYDRFFRRRLWR